MDGYGSFLDLALDQRNATFALLQFILNGGQLTRNLLSHSAKRIGGASTVGDTLLGGCYQLLQLFLGFVLGLQSIGELLFVLDKVRALLL